MCALGMEWALLCILQISDMHRKRTGVVVQIKYRAQGPKQSIEFCPTKNDKQNKLSVGYLIMLNDY